MTNSKKNFEQAIILTLGRGLGILFSFAIPFYLGRSLSIPQYGTYKQIMLFFAYAQVIFNMGMDWTIFYFIKREPRHLPLFSLNIVISNLLMTVLAFLALVWGRHEIAAMLNNPELAEYLPLLGLLLIFAVPSTQFEDLFLAIDKIQYKVGLDMGTELLKASVILGGYYFGFSLTGVIWGMILIYFSKLLMLLVFNWRLIKRDSLSLGPLPQYLWEQLKSSVPVGISNLTGILMEWDRMMISALFNVYRFTIYTVGLFEIPLIPSIRSNMMCLMNLEMVEAHHQGNEKKIVYLWQSITRKLFLIQVPVAVFMIFFASTVLTLVYSEKFAESVPYFQVFNVLLTLAMFSPNTIFLVFNRNRQLLIGQIISLILTMTTVFLAAYFWGPFWALIGKVVAVFFSTAYRLAFARKLMKVSWKDLFLWGQLGGITAISLGAGWVCQRIAVFFMWPKLITVTFFFGLFALLVFFLAAVTGLVKEDEKSYLKEMARKKIFQRFKMSPIRS